MRVAAVLACLLLSGCMIPQPDTPMIPPKGGHEPIIAQPGAPVLPPQLPMAQPVMAPDTSGAAASQPVGAPEMATDRASLARLVLKPAGVALKAIALWPEPQGEATRQSAVGEGEIEVGLAPGTYRLELELQDGRLLDWGGRLSLEAGSTRVFTLRVNANATSASLEESAPLVERR